MGRRRRRRRRGRRRRRRGGRRRRGRGWPEAEESGRRRRDRERRRSEGGEGRINAELALRRSRGVDRQWQACASTPRPLCDLPR